MVQRQKGFSLIELMIVVFLLGILAAMSTNIGSFFSNNQAQPYAGNLQTAMALAKSEAVKYKQEVRLLPLNATWNSGWKIVKIEPDASQTLVREFPALPDTLNMTSNDFTAANPPVFLPTGIITKAGSFSLKADGAKAGANREVNILISGQVQIKRS